MYPATLHGAGVITKPYFAIFAAFKESMTLNLAQTSSKVIDFGTNRKSVHIFLLVVNSNLDPILHRFRDTAAQMSNIEYREIMFAEFQPMWSRYLNVTDRQSDRQTTCLGNTALRVALRGKNESSCGQ